MKKIIYFCLLIFFALHTHAVADDVDNSDSYQRAERVMNNTMNQFIYAFFGKSLLINYIDDDKDIAAIKQLNEDELRYLSHPFNSNIAKFVMAGLIAIYWVTVMYFLVRLLLYAMESGWLLQRKGAIPMDQETFKSFSIKITLLGAMAIAPMSVNVSEEKQNIALYNLFLFDLMGKTHTMGNDSLSIMVQEQRKSLQTSKIPHADAKWSLGLALNEFMICVKLDAKRESTNNTIQRIDFYQTKEGKVEGILSSGRCNLKLTYGYEQQTAAMIEKILIADSDFPLSPQVFLDAQLEAFKGITQKVFEMAIATSTTLSLPHFQETAGGPENHERQFVKRGLTSEVLSYHELNRWETSCDTLNNEPFPHQSISRRDRRILHLHSARCYSKEVTRALLYPDEFGDVSGFLSDSTLLNRHIPICVDETEFRKQLADSRFSPRYTLNLVKDTPPEKQINKIEHLSLDACLAKYCSASSLQQGGLYACVNSIDLYQKRKNELAMEGRGLLMLGFYMFNLYNNQGPSERARHIYQSTDAYFSNNAIAQSDRVVQEPLFYVDVEIPGVIPNTSSRLSEIQTMLKNPFAEQEFALIENIDQKPLKSVVENALQQNRLLTCARNPLQIVEGYVCGNLPQEFSAFGMNVLRLAITAKGVLIIGDMMRKSGSPPGLSGVGEKSQISTTAFTKYIKLMGLGYIGEGIINSAMSSGFAETNEFGYLDQKSIRHVMYLDSRAIALISFSALANDITGSTLSTWIDNFILLLLFIGILCAIVIPLMPMLFVVYFLVKFIFKLFLTIAMTGINLTNAAFEDDANFLTESVDKIWSDWLALILKLPLLFVGVVLAWLMSNVIIAHVLQKMQISFLTNDGTMGPIDTLVMLVMVFGIVFVVYNTVMSVIESFYDFTVEWILGQMSNSPFSDRRAMGWKDSKDVLALMGR